jgi:prepilin-type processing-associated H-X9-DG protein
MARRVTIIGAVLFAVALGALLLTAIPNARLKANFVASQNNLREIALFAGHHAKPEATLAPNPRGKYDLSKLPAQVPPGTVLLPDVPPDLRLSWVVDLLPGMDQRRQDTVELLGRIDRAKPFLADANQKAVQTPVVALVCPESPPPVPPGSPAVTCYVGIAGVGPDAAGLPVGSPKAGAFRYDSATPFDRITDGISQTLLFAETRNEVGPWLRGGFATVRGLNDAPDAPPLVGGQFGGYFPNGANFALCDGSVRVFTPKTDPRVLLPLATIAGKEAELAPAD